MKHKLERATELEKQKKRNQENDKEWKSEAKDDDRSKR